MATRIDRKEHKDIPKTVLFTNETLDWAEQQAEEMNMSRSSYIRSLIIADKRKHQTALSEQKQANNRPIPQQVFTSPNGLYTAEQVAQLINAMRSEK